MRIADHSVPLPVDAAAAAEVAAPAAAAAAGPAALLAAMMAYILASTTYMARSWSEQDAVQPALSSNPPGQQSMLYPCTWRISQLCFNHVEKGSRGDSAEFREL